MAENYGVYINKKRNNLKLSIEGLASKAGVSKDTISRLESSESGVSIGKLEKVLSALDLRIGDIFESSKLDKKTERFIRDLYSLDEMERHDYVDLFSDVTHIIKTSNVKLS